MKTLQKLFADLQAAGRWDIDFHLPAEGIAKFPPGLLKRIDEVADVARDKRDPTKDPELAFQYIDISAVDVAVGVVSNPQDLEGNEAPSRARKVVRAFDVIVSTCRPTRGAIAVVPVTLHNQIASTAFSIVRPRDNINPFYLHYALRLPSTLEQFRKWSTGSSYPAILDGDVKKTLVPVPAPEVQDEIARKIVVALKERDKTIAVANRVWIQTLGGITSSLTGAEEVVGANDTDEETELTYTTAEVKRILRDLPPLQIDANGSEALDDLLDI
jgi:hypothetical protein